MTTSVQVARRRAWLQSPPPQQMLRREGNMWSQYHQDYVLWVEHYSQQPLWTAMKAAES